MNQDIQSHFIRIPNVVANCKTISIGAKYLYGYIWYCTYFGDFIKTNEQVCEALNVSLNTIRKYIRELKEAHFIAVSIEKNNTERHIKLLVTDEFIIRESQRVKNDIVYGEKPTKEVPECVQQFMNQIQ
jgi:DNA-binding transcriptional regulator LsrR (DeoR family)